MEEELSLLNDRPNLTVFQQAPLTLRPHFLGGSPVGTAREALVMYGNYALSRAQAGITLQPNWSRWDDPTLLDDQDNYWRDSRITAEVVRKSGGYIWVYDEPGFPSGGAGMRVLHGHPELQASAVACVWVDVEEGQTGSLELPEGQLLQAVAMPVVSGRLDGNVARYLPSPNCGSSISFRSESHTWRVMAFLRVFLYEGTFTFERHWRCFEEGAYSKRSDENFDWRDPAYAYPNLLDPRATQRFVDTAYEPYARHVGAYLGSVYKVFFTDEPSIPHRDYYPGRLSPTVPWYDGLEKDFQRRFGFEIRDNLPALFFNIGGKEIDVRCAFYTLIADTFAENFVRKLTDWCTQHNVYFGGHLYFEEILARHITGYGSLLRSAREMSMPGIDHLGGGFVGRSMMNSPVTGYMSEFGATVPKLISSAAHLGGWARTMSESHGFAGKETGSTYSEQVAVANWETVLGINTLPYYSFDWLGDDDEQKRKYSVYAGRLGYMTAGGIHRAEVAVLYPIATAWAAYSPADARLEPDRNRWQIWTDSQLDRLQSTYDDVSRGLLERQLDFDYLDETDIISAQIEDGRLHVGIETFSAVVLPGATVLSAETMYKLEAFRHEGGHVFVAGTLPQRAHRESEWDVVQRVAAAWAEAENIVFREDPIATAEAVRASIIRDVVLEPETTDIYVLHKSKRGCEVYFLANNGVKDYEGRVSFSTLGEPQLWNAWHGKAYALEHQSTGKCTNVALHLPGRTACFVVFGADSIGLTEPDKAMWEFGPKPTTVRDRSEWAKTWHLKRYFPDAPVKRADARELDWGLLSPDSDLQLRGRSGGRAASVEVPTWRRLGYLLEGLESYQMLEAGVYELEFEALAENLDIWGVIPRHFGPEGELFEKGVTYVGARHSLSMPGPHDWVRVTFCFRIPDGAEQTSVLLYPLNKVYFSRPSTLAVRSASLCRLCESQPEGE